MPHASDRTFTDLVKSQGPRLYALALRLCRNAADAEDIVQTTFLQAHRKWSTFEGRSAPGTWLHVIAARLCARKLRNDRRPGRRMPPLSDLLPFGDPTVAATAKGATGDSPMNTQIAREAREALEYAIVRLPPAFRVPLVLKDIAELPTAEVARALNIKPQTVKTRVHRARLLLRGEMLRHVPKLPAPPPIYDRRVCLDLLNAKLDAMDRGRDAIGPDVLCERCRGVFAELDLVQNACARLADGSTPPGVLRRLASRLEAETYGGKPFHRKPPRSRRPLK